MLKLFSRSGDDREAPALGTGTTDAVLGLTYGYEARTWYRWASVRYRYNGKTADGLRRGDIYLVDVAGGWRPRRRGYREPDAIWLLEINGTHSGNARLNGAEVAGTGSTQWFLSPGFFWTLHNFAMKVGVQIPFHDDLNGTRSRSNYRANLTFEWHL
ncbi:MAG: hypothetical protein ACE5OQ_09155 [Woeseia sp.]